MKVLNIERIILRKIGVSVKCHRPGCGEVVPRGGAIFIHKGNKFCCRYCAEAFYQGKKFKGVRKG